MSCSRVECGEVLLNVILSAEWLPPVTYRSRESGLCSSQLHLAQLDQHLEALPTSVNVA